MGRLGHDNGDDLLDGVLLAVDADVPRPIRSRNVGVELEDARRVPWDAVTLIVEQLVDDGVSSVGVRMYRDVSGRAVPR